MEINDEERRRVAQRMRNEIHFMRLNREWYESEDDMVECGNRAFRDIANAVIPYSCLGNDYIGVVERLADLIDREMVEDERLKKENADWKGNAEGFQPDAYMKLPLDADGEPIRIGDVLYSRGNECSVVSITVKADESCVGVHTDEGVFLPSVNPKYLSRKNPEPLEPEPPDSLERIAGDIESAKGWCDQNGDYGTESVSISKPKLIKWADRIRKLADKEGEHATN